MSVKFVHTADVHIGMNFKTASFAREKGKERRKETLDTFMATVERVRETNADLLLIAGDLFEEEYVTVSDLKRVNSKFAEIPNTKIVMVTGNHDPLEVRSLYKLINWQPNAHIFGLNVHESIYFEDLNTRIHGYSWDKKIEENHRVDNIIVKNKENINILLIHGDIAESSKYLPIRKKDLVEKGFDYVALGHIHKPEIIDNFIVYPGSPEPLDFGELGKHGIVEGEISKSRNKLHFNSLAKREFIRETIEIKPEATSLDLENSIKAIGSEDSKKKDMYRVTVKGLRDNSLDLNDMHLVENLKEHFYYIELKDETTLNYDLEELEKENKNNIIGLFIKEMRNRGLDNEENRDALYEGLEVLLSEKAVI